MADYKESRDKVALQITLLATGVLLEKGMKQSVAVMIGAEIAKELFRQMGGSLYYIPQLATINEAADRAALICAEFDGKNYRAVAIKFGLSERRVREIVKRAEKTKAGKGGKL